MQGVVYWQPPETALEKVKQMVWDPLVSRYGADEGLPELRNALHEKVQHFNSLAGHSGHCEASELERMPCNLLLKILKDLS